MPIKGLTSRDDLKPRLPRLGKLRKGAEKKGNKPGQDLSHFRFTSDNEKVEKAFYDAYSKEPRVINVILFHETLEENFETWIEAWDSSGLVFRSDGENWVVWRDGSSYIRGKKAHQDHPDQKEVGRLEVIIPELLQQGFVGSVTLETHGNHDLRNIASVLMTAEEERGSLRGAQFVLRRVEEEISVPGWGDRKGQRSKAKKWLVKLEMPRRIFENLLNAPEPEKQLPESVDIETGEVVEVEAEPEPEPQQTSSDRPFSPDVLIEKLRKSAQDKLQKNNALDMPVDTRVAQVLGAKMPGLFPEDDARNLYHTFLNDIFPFKAGEELSANNLRHYQAITLGAWLFGKPMQTIGDGKPKDWFAAKIDSMAQAEANLWYQNYLAGWQGTVTEEEELNHEENFEIPFN